MIQEPNILHYWTDDLPDLRPLKGGNPNFSRAGNAFGVVRDSHAIPMVADTPRLEPDGLRLELSSTNHITGNPFDTSAWTGSSIASQTAVTSLYDGKTAQEVVGSGLSAANVEENAGTWTSGTEFAFHIVEQTTSDKVMLRVGGGGVAQPDGTFTFSTETLTVDASVDDSGFLKLFDVGPNGGVVYLIWLKYSGGNSGNTRTISQWPDRDGDGEGAIFHYAKVAETGAIIDSAVDGTRATETFYWESAPKPQAMVIYCKFKALMVGDGGLGTARILQMGGNGNPRLDVFFVTTTGLRLFLNDGTNFSNNDVTVAIEPADVVEFVVIFNNDGTGRFIVSLNDAAVASVAVSMTWTNPSAWFDNVQALNSVSNGTGKGASQPQQLKIVKQTNVQSALDGTGTGDEDIMKEMAGLVYDPHQDVAYNVNI